MSGEPSKMKPKNLRELESAPRTQDEIEISGSLLSESRSRASKKREVSEVIDVSSDSSSDDDEPIKKSRSATMGCRHGVLGHRDDNPAKTPKEVKATASLRRRQLKRRAELAGLPTTMRKVLETKLLEGMPVWYFSKGKNCFTGLRGVIKGIRISCYCKACKGDKEIFPTHFEIHAGSKAKHPSDFIYLGNGKSIRDVVDFCMKADVDSLSTVIRNIINYDPHSEPNWPLIVSYAAYRIRLECGEHDGIADSGYEDARFDTARFRGMDPSSRAKSSVQRPPLGRTSRPALKAYASPGSGSTEREAPSVESAWANRNRNSTSAKTLGRASPTSPDDRHSSNGWISSLTKRVTPEKTPPRASAQINPASINARVMQNASVERTLNTAPKPSSISSAQTQLNSPTIRANCPRFVGFILIQESSSPYGTIQWQEFATTGECSRSVESLKECILDSIQRATQARTCDTPPSNDTFGRRMITQNIDSANEPISNSVQRSSLRIRSCNSARKTYQSSSYMMAPQKDSRLHQLVFDEDILPNGTELKYFVDGEEKNVGLKTENGIFCDCCKRPVSPSEFERHSGYGYHKSPYRRIYTSNGVSLHEISVSIAEARELSDDFRNELCYVCHGPEESGVLRTCDGCPRVYHRICVPISNNPNDKWYCKICEDKFEDERGSELNPNAVAAGRIPGVDAMEQIRNHCIRILNIPPRDTACALCREQDYTTSGFGPRTMVICDQCDKEYHVGCLREHRMQYLQDLPRGEWFCSIPCGRINFLLGEELIKGYQRLPDDLVDFVKSKRTPEELKWGDLDISWRVIHGRKSTSPEVRPLLSKTVSVFHDRFSKIPYGEGQDDMIHHMVHAKDLADKELGGMYCAVLTVNSTIVSAAVFRLFSKEMTEIPLIATRNECDGKGYSYCLYTCIERFLRGLGVRNLVVHAANERRSVWRNKFGFKAMPKEVDELTKFYPITEFSGTSVLYKMIAEP